MRKIKEVLRLRNELKLDQRQIARSCSISVSTVHEYLKRAAAANLSWPLPDDWDDAHLEAALFPSPGASPQPPTGKAAPDFAAIHEQLQRHRHVTLQLVWEEYRDANPDGYRYSRFCELYQRCPIEYAFGSNDGPGWRASQGGEQQIRITFDKPVSVHRIELRFHEADCERTQEFILRWSSESGGSATEIVRQQWNFSPTGSTTEIEHYVVDLDAVSVLELAIRPDLRRPEAVASLASWRLGYATAASPE